MCHSTTADKKSQNPPPSKSEHDHVLEHSLHQLLREVHHKNTHHPFPHPATGPLGPSKKRMMAGKLHWSKCSFSMTRIAYGIVNISSICDEADILLLYYQPTKGLFSTNGTAKWPQIVNI